MKGFSKFLIFIGLILIGCFFYMQFVGDIPFIDKVFDNMGVVEKDDEVIGQPIKVEKIDNIEYNPTVGNEFAYDKEEINNNVNSTFFINVKLGNEPYRLSFKYPDYLKLLRAEEKELVLGNEEGNVNISFSNTDIKPEEYLNNKSVIMPNDEYYFKSYSVSNEVSKVYITNIYEKYENIYMNKADYLIYNLNEEGNALYIKMLTRDKKIPDSLITNFYNNFTFEKIDNDFKFCKLENNKYICSLKLNNYDNSNKDVFRLEFDADLYDVIEEEDALIPSSAIIETKEGSSNSANIYISIEYDGTGTRKKQLEASYYSDEVVNGYKARVRNYTSNPNKKVYNYEIIPNTYLRIEVDTSEGFFDTASNTFNGFKVSR